MTIQRRLRPGLTDYGPLDETRRSPLLTPGTDLSRTLPDAGGPLSPAPTWRPLAGASANNRGQAVIVTIDASGTALVPGFQPAQRIPSIVQSPRGEGDFDGELISVRLGMFLPAPFSDPTSPYATFPIDVLCLLEFGVGGVSYTAEVDWNQGTVFGVSASYLRVSALVGEVTSNVFPAAIQFNLQASLAYGDAGNSGISSQARRTFNLGDAIVAGNKINPGATSALIPIPFWAVGFTLTDAGSFPALAPVVPDYTINLFDNVGTNSATFKQTDRSNLADQVEGHFPIPARSRFISITNNLGVAMKAPRLVFNLAL